jgi:4'-phosphopantetheinyl transferase
MMGEMMLAFQSVEKALWSGPRIELRADDVHVWGVVLEAETEIVEQCLRCLSAEESGRANRFKSEQQRCHFLVAHGALRMVLSRYSDRGPRELSFQNTPSGKPMLQATDASVNAIRFNLSHSHGRALIAVSKDREVGVDLEKIRADRDVTALAGRFFAPQEHVLIMSADIGKRHWAFSRIWVAKEAVLKARGSGLTFPLDHHRIELSEDGTACRFISEDNPSDSAPPGIRFLPLEEGWVGAIAAEGSAWSVTLCT